MKTFIIMLLLSISILCTIASAEECRVQLFNTTGGQISFSLYDNAMQQRAIDYGSIAHGMVVTRRLQVKSDKLRLEYKVIDIVGPTGVKPKLKVHEIPCGAFIQINR
jgi:hypothetical protein